MPPHDSLLAYHVLLYAIQALSEGDLKAIKDLDFTIDEIRQLSQLPVKAIKHLARMSSHFLEIKTDHSCFNKIMIHLHQELASDALQDELLRLEAPITMMSTLFGMSTTEYLQRQKLLGIPGRGAGRPALPSDDEQIAIWESWVKTEGMSLPERYQQVGQETGQPLRALWSLIQSWESTRDSHRKETRCGRV